VGPVVEVDVNGVWTPVFNEFWSPSQPVDGDPDSDHSFETFVATFDPVLTRGIRLTGNAGGQDHFISVGELTVTTLVGTNCPRAEPLTAAGPPPGGGAATTCVSTDTVGVPFDTLTELGLLPEGGGNHDISVIRDGVVPEVGSQDSATQYDTYVGGGGHGAQSIGYLFEQPFMIHQLTYTEGKHFWVKDASRFVDLSCCPSR